MQSTSIFSKSLEPTLTKRKRYDHKSPIYKTRKWRANQPILTPAQMRELGKCIGINTLPRSVDHFMNPANMFTLNKPKLALVHEFLLARGLERGEIATSKILQSVYANYLFNVLYPGFPVWRAKEQATKILRETVNKSRKSARPGLAYDQLPTCDIFERLDELIRIDVPPIPYNEEDCDAEWVQTIAVPLNKQILQYAQERVKEKKKDRRDIRLHLYLWLSNWISWEPYPTQFSVDSKDQWTETDQKAIEKHGYRHIDITDKVDWNDVLAERKQNGEIVLEFDCDAEIKQLSICTVWQKTPAELASHLYVLTAGSYICRLIEHATSQAQVASIQEQALKLLGKKNADRSNIYYTRSLLQDCMDIVESTGTKPNTMADQDDDLIMCDQTISLSDPLLLTRIEYPARGVYCSHAACFDAASLFKCVGLARVWQCPLCAVQYKSIQDLYIDYDMDQALAKYPDQSKLILRDGVLLAPEETPTMKKVKVECI